MNLLYKIFIKQQDKEQDLIAKWIILNPLNNHLKTKILKYLKRKVSHTKRKLSWRTYIVKI